MSLTRADWAGHADRMLLALRPFADAGHARIDLPGPPSANGPQSDSLEAFARSFLLAAIRLRGEDGADPHGFAEWYAAGLAAGTDPASPVVWPRPDRLPQAKVEACSIALGLHLSRPWLWDRLGRTTQRHVVAWLSTVVGEWYPPINWVWFQIVVETFLRDVDGPWARADIQRGLAVHESLHRAGGWYSDGDERAFDHYGGWALHVYPLLWAGFAGDLCPDELRQAWRDRLTAFLDDAVTLVGADGSPLLQGRSLAYRFAAAAPFWVAAITGTGNLAPGLLRRACSGMLGHFTAHGVPDERGLLNLGWHRAWPAMAQSYSGPGSPYWAVKGMLGLALPAGHPVWTDEECPLPVETADLVRPMPSPGWLASATRADGIVRIVNHGTDHAAPGDERTDAPLYARLGYSTATLPPLTGATVGRPADNSVTLVDGDGRATHRSGFEPLLCDVVDGTGRALSRAAAHWVSIVDESPDHGSGRRGVVRPGPLITMGSLVRGAVEVRVARLDSATGLDPATRLEFSGWPVAQDTPPEGEGATVRGDRLVSTVAGAGFAAGIRREAGTSPLGEHVAVPVLLTTGPPEPGRVYAVVVGLRGAAVPDGPPPAVAVSAGGVAVRWADGARAELPLPPVTTAADGSWRSPG